jgi:hypothetical protein
MLHSSNAESFLAVVTFNQALNQRVKGFDVAIKGNTPACFPNVTSEYFLEFT